MPGLCVVQAGLEPATFLPVLELEAAPLHSSHPACSSLPDDAHCQEDESQHQANHSNQHLVSGRVRLDTWEEENSGLMSPPEAQHSLVADRDADYQHEDH